MKALSALLLAFWPVWHWYLARSADGSDEPWGILALLTATIYIAKFGKSRAGSPSLPALFILTLYITSYSFVPSLMRAGLAMLCLILILSPQFFGRKIHLGLAGLLLLSLPIIASLQFYAGYPLRVVTGKIVALLITLSGEYVTAIGSSLLWRGDIISIDAPCSGIKMLWGGLYVAFALACFNGLTNHRTWIAYVFASFSIFFANVGRTYVLFFTESGIVTAPYWFHSTAGLIWFAFALILIIMFNSYLKVDHEAIHFYNTNYPGSYPSPLDS